MSAPKHELTIREVHTSGWTSYGPVPIVLGYIGHCVCGHESPQHGSRQIVDMWFEYHTGKRGLHKESRHA